MTEKCLRDAMGVVTCGDLFRERAACMHVMTPHTTRWLLKVQTIHVLAWKLHSKAPTTGSSVFLGCSPDNDFFFCGINGAWKVKCSVWNKYRVRLHHLTSDKSVSRRIRHSVCLVLSGIWPYSQGVEMITTRLSLPIEIPLFGSACTKNKPCAAAGCNVSLTFALLLFRFRYRLASLARTTTWQRNRRRRLVRSLANK